MFQCFYKNGKLDGDSKMWRENGQLACHKQWENGLLIEKEK